VRCRSEVGRVDKTKQRRPTEGDKQKTEMRVFLRDTKEVKKEFCMELIRDINKIK